MAALGCAWTQLDLLDCIWRRDESGQLLYRTQASLWAEPVAGDGAHIEDVRAALRELVAKGDDPLVIGPMAIGRHVDHRICARAVLELAAIRPGARLLLYEDFPYVVDASVGDGFEDCAGDALARLGVDARPFAYVPVGVDAKSRVLDRYETQVAMLFDDAERMREVVAAHVYEGAPAELYWQPTA